MKRLSVNLGELLPKNINDIITQFESCGPCQECMDACPICSVDFPQKDANQRYQREDIMRWLISCAGCGMCEQACSKNLPLGIIFSHIREQLDEEYNYQTGKSVQDALPTLH
jgi:CO dehydrogenase/acetyl-CoA synthase alpha subunit